MKLLKTHNMKYTFIEFLAAYEGDDFDVIDPMWLDHYKKSVNAYSEMLEKESHGGDCTKEPYTCGLCLIEHQLKDYREYVFNEEKWRNDNGIENKL